MEKEAVSYKKVITALKQRRNKATVADIVHGTALPIERVRELMPRAADEFSGRIEVTESGEILYSFPRGFVSKYKGLGPALKRFGEKFGLAVKTAGMALFKVWIMVMLVGYFLVFLLLALGVTFISMGGGGKSSSRSSSRGSFGFLDLFIRLWFYSEMTKSYQPQQKAKGKPLYQAIFSFVFGDGDPNSKWESREKKALIAYIQAHRGVIALPEYMALTGKPPSEAEDAICAFCAEFGGSPEATPDGTVVYRFDDLLRREDRRDRSFSGFSGPLKSLVPFSYNKKGFNFAVALINGVNVAFGGYYLWNSITVANPLQMPALKTFYGQTFHLIRGLTGAAPTQGAIAVGLGLVPLAFSVLFWLIPALRKAGLDRKNRRIKEENLRKALYAEIWQHPRSFHEDDVKAADPALTPAHPARAKSALVKEIGAYSIPDVALDESGRTCFDFRELDREKASLEAYRAAISPDAGALGETVFDSDGRVV